MRYNRRGKYGRPSFLSLVIHSLLKRRKLHVSPHTFVVLLCNQEHSLTALSDRVHASILMKNSMLFARRCMTLFYQVYEQCMRNSSSTTFGNLQLVKPFHLTRQLNLGTQSAADWLTMLCWIPNHAAWRGSMHNKESKSVRNFSSPKRREQGQTYSAFLRFSSFGGDF